MLAFGMNCKGELEFVHQREGQCAFEAVGAMEERHEEEGLLPGMNLVRALT